MGYLTLRLRGAFFAIATLALAVVLQTLIVNWDFVGGSRGAYIVRPEAIAPFGSYIKYLFLVMMLLAIGAIMVARLIERSRLGYGFATIRDDELAAEASGVPTLRLKLIATTISGALMGMAGAPFPYYIGFLQPSSAFGLDYAVNSIAMPLIGGTTSWVGPLVGAMLLGPLQQLATVTISSAVNLLIVGLLLVGFVIVAPNGIIGLVQKFIRHRPVGQVGRRRIEADASGHVHEFDDDRRRACCRHAAANALLDIDNLGKRFGGFVALDGISLAVKAGERLGLIGPNGSGKSTLVNCICGTLQNEVGSVTFDGQRLNGMSAHQRTRRGLSRTFQLPRPFASLTLADNMRVPLLYTVASRAHGPRRRRHRGALPRASARSRARGQSAPAAAGTHPGRDAQARACAHHGGRAEASDRRRVHGRPHSFGGRRDFGAADAAQRPGRHHHSDRAHHERGDELLAAACRAGLRAQDRRRRAECGDARSGSREGVSWPVA